MGSELTSVLQLPLEKQREIARRSGFATLEAWQEDVKKSHEEAQAHVATLKTVSYYDLPPDEQEAAIRWMNKCKSDYSKPNVTRESLEAKRPR
jgi:hypothetical protein